MLVCPSASAKTSVIARCIFVYLFAFVVIVCVIFYRPSDVHYLWIMVQKMYAVNAMLFNDCWFLFALTTLFTVSLNTNMPTYTHTYTHVCGTCRWQLWNGNCLLLCCYFCVFLPILVWIFHFRGAICLYIGVCMCVWSYCEYVNYDIYAFHSRSACITYIIDVVDEQCEGQNVCLGWSELPHYAYFHLFRYAYKVAKCIFVI